MSEETCIVCGKSTAGDRGFAHRYHGGRRFPVCCPMCLQMFERAPDRFARTAGLNASSTNWSRK